MRFAKTVTALALACSLALAIPTFAAPAAEEQAGRQEDLSCSIRPSGIATPAPSPIRRSRSSLPASLRSRPG